ncbi:hypothetical protein SAMN04487846_3189 [Microbacterium sp. cf046]|uniref:hypothetical protein n=1 Tax=Microbacterium sp. cf046 TaxID=1761803 RepID=UPI0008E0BF28|nr:hypothetical protein [Microbacterium sp. cf046]SFS15845.1 hypothetical protein SAMN04487846_3189 [Microbacterium sp. cf046]
MTLTQAQLDALWDFSNPEATEVRLRTAELAAADAEERAELQTQVARSLGLHERFAEGDAVLDAIASDDPAVRARVALERGRLRNSAGDAAAAVPLFVAAAEAAASAGLLFLQVDALHMLAIADADGSAEWTRQALSLLEQTDDPRTLRWNVSLHNNAGWTHFDAGRFAEAVAAFERSRDAAVRWGTAQQVQWADEAIAEARAARDDGR